MVPRLGSQLIFKLEQEPGVQGATSAQLWVRLANEGYRTAAMPGSWDTAVVTLSGGNLGGPQAKTIAKTSFDGSNQTTASYTGLRPGSGYALNVKLYTGGAGGTLQAEGTQSPLTLVAGSQAVTVTLALSAPPGDVSLRGIQPSVASAGQTLVLEGHGFQGGATVNFPGAGAVAATVLGANRLSVTVPAGATAGNLTVTSGGTTTNALDFRKASYTLGLQRFQSRYEQAATAQKAPSLVASRVGHASVTIGRYLYVLGGEGTNTVERASIQPDGTLGAFSAVAGVTLTVIRHGHSALRLGNHLYVIGGHNANSLATVERATINGDDTLSNFTTVAGVNLRGARGNHSATVIGGYLYVVGGYNIYDVASLDSVERATINADGTLSDFAIVGGVSLVGSRGHHAAVIVGNYLYALGGMYADYDTSYSLNGVERATINGDGTISSFSAVGGVTLAAARDNMTAQVIGNGLYILGGNGAATSVERATIAVDGTLSTFATVAGLTLTTARTRHTGALIGNHLYLLGGESGPTSIERSVINTSGNLSTFAAVAGVTLTTARSWFGGSPVLGNYVYTIGGYSGSSIGTVERASVNADGTLSTFSSVPGVNLEMARSAHSMVVVGNYLYAIAGWAVDGYNTGSVERATINADGTISSFSTVPGVSLNQVREGFATAVIGNYLYVIGGYYWDEDEIDIDLDDVERATINADGTISNFSTVPGVTLPARFHGHSSVVIGNYLYVLGGYNVFDGGHRASIVRATLNADGTMSTFSTVPGVSLVAARDGHSGAVIGNHLYVAGGTGTTGTLGSVERATINSDGTIGTFATVAGVTLATGRHGYGSAVIRNNLYVIGGYNGGLLDSVERAVLQ